MARRRLSISFRRFLTIAALVILLPFLLLQLTQQYHDSVLHQSSVGAELRGMAKSVAAQLDAGLMEWLEDVVDLDNAIPLDGFDTGDPAGTQRILGENLKQHQETRSLSVLGADGRVIAQVGDLTNPEISAISDSMELPKVAQRPMQRSFSGLLNVAGDGERLIALAIPIKRAASVEGVLLSVKRPDEFNAIVEADDAQLGWQAAIIDQHNIIVAHTDSALVGRPSPYEEPQANPVKTEPTMLRTAFEGTGAYLVSRRSAVAPWRVVYQVPVGSFGDAHESNIFEFSVLAIVLALPLTASALLGRYLGRRIGDLAEAARLVSNEAAPAAMVPTGLREIDVVQEALRHAGEAAQERAAAREQMSHMEQALHRAQRVESLGQLTAGIAHDFGNIVFTIRGNLELIKRALGNDERLQALIEPPLRLASEATQLISQLSAGIRHKQYKVQHVNVNQLLHEVADLLRQVAGKTIRLRLDLADDLFDCRLDATLLKSALLNLVINARNAMPGGGEIVIRSRNRVLDREAANAAGLRSDINYIALSVADTGVGITPEVRARLFEPFFTTREGEIGTGIGLSILYGFVKATGGQVVVDSIVGAGTTFTMYFPARLTLNAPMLMSTRVDVPIS